MLHFKKIIFVISILILFLNFNNSYAIGDFSLGINTGITYDLNNLGKYTSQINKFIESSNGAQIDTPYAFLLGCSLRYHFNYLLFRLGGHFAKPGRVKGSYTPPGGQKNEIRISTYQTSFPLSLGFLMPLKERTYFYFGGGITYHSAYVKITQSDPSLGNNIRDRYAGNFAGWHLLAGAEVPLLDNYTISVEWIHQEARSYPIANDGLDTTGTPISSPKYMINAGGDFFLFGINYYISI